MSNEFNTRPLTEVVAWRGLPPRVQFLGDVYQDLSERSRKLYALLQTPEFIETFVRDQALTPAVERFGLGR